MKHINNLNKFDLIRENLDVYDFGRKRGDLDDYYNKACELTKQFPLEVESQLVVALPSFSIKHMTGMFEYGNDYLYLKLGFDIDCFWVIQYYGDYCYGLFRYKEDDGDDLEWVEFCDDIEPVIIRLNRQEKKLKV